MKLFWWRNRKNKKVTQVDRDSADTDRRLEEAKRAAERGQRALDKVIAREPIVQAHRSALRRVADDNGLAGIILFGFSKGTK